MSNLLSKTNLTLASFVVLAMPSLVMSYIELIFSVVLTDRQWSISLYLMFAFILVLMAINIFVDEE